MLEVSGASTFATDWFTRGVIEVVGGRTIGVKRHRKIGTVTRLDLWQPPPQAVVIGDTLTLRAGCDKQIKTCRAKFNNAPNYRGFPHMPGNDAVMQVAGSGAQES
jgi:uncharacterized phage protein (TIGR02218 family)